MNDETHPKQPKRQDHKIIFGRLVEALAGDKAKALTESLQQVICFAEDATDARVRFEVVALNCQTESKFDRTSVGRIEEAHDALNMYHSVVRGKGNWYHFHYKLKLTSDEWGDYERFRRELVTCVRSTTTVRPSNPGIIGVLRSAFVAAENGGKLPAPAPAPKRFGTPLPKLARVPVGKAKRAPVPPMKSPEAKAPEAKSLPKKKAALPKKSVAGPMPIDLGGADELTLFALSCRDAGLARGAWLSAGDLADAIKLAIVGSCSVDGDVPDEWVRVCRIRLSGADLLRDHAAEGETYWQLVLDGETETEFAPPVVSPEPAPAPPEEEEPPPASTSEPEPPLAVPDEPTEPEAPTVEILLARLQTLNGTVARLTGELAAAVEQQGEVLAALRAQAPTS